MKQFSAKRSIQILGHILEQYGVEHMVISPGSRNAPLAIHFSELDKIQCFSIVDERSAGFVALGMAKSLGTPVALSCTSGSAVVNYYPAVVEAFYSNIPLLILTADRPTHFIDIFDGQTIRQNQIFSQHSYGDFQLLEDHEPNAEQENMAIIQKAVELCLEKQGPVHINIPLSEPLYEYVSELPIFPKIKKNQPKKDFQIPAHLVEKWNNAKKILILTGTLDKNEKLEFLLSQMAENQSAVVLTEINSNLHSKDFFPHIDRYFFNFNDEELPDFAPDLLITIGQNVVSKKVKEFLRKYQPKEHWHIDPHWQPDTFFALTEKIVARAEDFFAQLIPKIHLLPSDFFQKWNEKKMILEQKHQQYLSNADFSDFQVYDIVKDCIPENYNIHFSNSSVIRYAQLFDFQPSHHFFCNRGVSGIEGSTSTAMGYAMASPRPTLLITGDLSFFYDINGLWNGYIPAETRIIIINNGGGNIFHIIPGPSSANALDEFIATHHQKNAENIAKHFGLEYENVSSRQELECILQNFFEKSHRPKLLEINTSGLNNAEVLKNYFKAMK